MLRARAFDTIVFGGLTAGVLDIGYAFGMSLARGGQPQRVLQAIASGLLGPSSFDGGWTTAGLGLGLHFVIACGAATTFLLASRLAPSMLRRPFVTGPAFGLAVWAVMYQVVLPLSLVRGGGSPTWPVLAGQLAIHMFGVGLPIAFIAARSARIAVRRQGASQELS